MSGSAKRIARLAVLTALGTVLLVLAHLVPAGRLGLLLVVSFPVCAALMLYGSGWAFAVFAVTAALGFLLFPGTTVIGYGLFFGYYPIAKSLFERLWSASAGWALKLLLYAAAFGLYRLLARSLFPDTALPWYVLLVLGTAAFVVYDWCYSIVIRFYIDKIARYIQ